MVALVGSLRKGPSPQRLWPSVLILVSDGRGRLPALQDM